MEHVFISRISSSVQAPVDAPVGESSSFQDVTSVFTIDATNTRDSISKLATDSFSFMGFQQQALTRLQQGCISARGDLCWSINTNISHV
ncbi:MAG: hypothetical protein K7J15_02805, partial [Candidatus Regiella insecticola]|nr:hypothetical protein [Candidatus Regiella insecticola]